MNVLARRIEHRVPAQTREQKSSADLDGLREGRFGVCASGDGNQNVIQRVSIFIVPLCLCDGRDGGSHLRGWIEQQIKEAQGAAFV